MLYLQVEESPNKEAKTNTEAQKNKEEQPKTAKDKQTGSKVSQKKGSSSSSRSWYHKVREKSVIFTNLKIKLT